MKQKKGVVAKAMAKKIRRNKLRKRKLDIKRV